MDDAQSIVNIVAGVLKLNKIAFDTNVMQSIENEIRESFQGCQLYITRTPTTGIEKTMKLREEYRNAVRKICREHNVSEAYLKVCVRTKPAKPKGENDE